MKYGKVISGDDLRIGQIVRCIRGYPSVVGGEDDFRQSYDCMTVYNMTAETVDFIRPYLHLDKDGRLSAMGFERVDGVSKRPAFRYELLQEPH
jgi:hypothetical protein